MPRPAPRVAPATSTTFFASGFSMCCTIMSSVSMALQDESFVDAIEHPTSAKAIDEKSKICAPKHVLQGHFYFAAFREGCKKTLGLGARVRLKIYGYVIAARESKAHRFRAIRP